MSEPIPIPEIEIVGYANRLVAAMLPAVVPPVFRSKSEPERFFLPPYVMQAGQVWNANTRTHEEVLRLEQDGELTLFAEPLDARPDFELWIDQQEVPRYQPILDAAAELRKIAEACVESAVKALEAGDYSEAKEAARTAMCANDRLIEPLAIRAAIARKERERGQETLMTKLVVSRVTKVGFELMVAGYEKMMAAGTNVIPVDDLFKHRPMRGIAAERAA